MRITGLSHTHDYNLPAYRDQSWNSCKDHLPVIQRTPSNPANPWDQSKCPDYWGEFVLKAYFGTFRVARIQGWPHFRGPD